MKDNKNKNDKKDKLVWSVNCPCCIEVVQKEHDQYCSIQTFKCQSCETEFAINDDYLCANTDGMFVDENEVIK